MSKPRGQLALRRLALPVPSMKLASRQISGGRASSRAVFFNGLLGGSPQPAARDGIALIIVLGMLSLMVLMGVSFSIYMRTGRVAAGNFRNDVRARQLLYVALNRAMDDVNTNLTTSLYPAWDCLVSDEANSDNIVGVLNPPAMDWIPLAAMGTNLQPRWITNGVGSGGRIGYLVVNCSGFLDANYVGGQPRALGTNASEVQLSDIAEVASVNALVSDRAPKPLETMQELNVRGVAQGFLRGPSQHFVTFSAFPTNGLVYVGGPASNLVTRSSEITAALGNVFSPSQAQTVYGNLVDYADTNLIPGDFDGTVAGGNVQGPFVEPVPMFNEVYFTNRITFTPTNPPSGGPKYILGGTVTPRFEFIYPFPAGTTRNGYTFNYAIIYDGDPLYVPAGGVISGSVAVNVPAGAECYAPLLLLPPIKTRIFGQGTVLDALPPPFTIKVTVSGWMTYGGNIVDAATNVTLNLICPAPAIAGTDYIMGDSDCRESRDPRMNFLATEWRAPGGGVDNSLNATNKQTLREWGQPGFGLVPNGWEGRDLDMVMHVANRPLQTVGELGNLYIGAHFETVRLYKHGNKATYGLVHRVLNYFTVDHPAGPASKGKVNLNTRDADVIRAVYADMPINAPAGNGMTKVTDSLLDDVVTAIEDVGLSGSQFASLAELGERINWAGIYPAGNDLEKESFVRNAVGLFGTRQNFFVIVLKAETTKSVLSQQGSNMVSVVSGVRAVAEVWRDPVADGTGFHPYFVRTFKILTE